MTRPATVIACVVVLGAVLLSQGRPAIAQNQARQDALRRYEAALAAPADPSVRADFLAGLPKIGEYYLLEGDMRLTEDEVIEYLIANGGPNRRQQVVTPELVVNMHRGQSDFYPPDRRTLTYYLDRATFRSAVEFMRVAEDLAAATGEWEQACAGCGVRFVRVMERSGPRPNFVVRAFDAGGEFVAAAFFPHTAPARRTLDIDPSYFTTKFRPVGVLRHELGHVLGYRHEQVRGVRGCYREDRLWAPLTEYDPKSVMHYFCGGAGTRELELTHLDREGHRRLYAPATTAAPPPAAVPASAPAAALSAASTGLAEPASEGVLVVSLEGGEVADNAASVLRLLHGLGVLPLDRHRVEKGEVIDAIFKQHLGLPFHAEAMTAFAGELNRKNYLSRPLSVGETVRLPAVRFIEDTYGIRDDRRRVQTIEQNWDHLVTKSGSESAASARQSTVRVEVRRFELRLPIADQRALAEAIRRIRALPTKNVVATAERTTAAQSKYFAQPEPRSTAGLYTSLDDFVRNRDALKEGDQGTVLSLLDDRPDPVTRTCQKDCPEVILVDKKLSVHPDLKDAVRGDDLDNTAADLPLVKDGRQTVELVDWDEAFHATHLAGIIGARDNRFGIVGVDPHAQITAWNWEVLRDQPTSAAREVSLRQADADTRNSLQIYTFATEWAAPQPPGGDARISDDILARRLLNERPLVIVAAGQATTAAGAVKISETSARAPVNLGDQENVLVVTACTRCGGADAAIMPEAHHSRDFVHVAAPGANVLSTANGAKYARGQGTSQATAFVAGLASLMAGRYPNQYGEAFQVKVRLQVTSTPFELVGKPMAGRELAAGIVAPSIAMLDPSRHWMKRNGQPRVEIADAQHVRAFAWTADTLYLEDADGNSVAVPLESVWRLVRRPGSDRWVAYTGSRKGPIRKIGPARLRPAEGNKVLFRLNGEDIRPSMLEDLLLTYPSSGR